MRGIRKSEYSIPDLLEENALLREEVQVARKASDLTAELVVEQFIKIEKMLQRLEESESRFRDLYHRSSEREQLYESLLHSTPDAVVIYDLDTVVTYVNPAFTQIFGFTLEEIGKTPLPLVPETERNRVAEKLERVKEGESLSGWETKRVTKDGTLLDVTVSASCYYDAGGKPAGVMTILRNVTERKQAEALLKKERETFFTILDKAPYGVGLLDKDGRILYFNSKFTEITGYSAEDTPTVGDWFRTVYPDPKYRQQVIDSWEKGIRGEKNKSFKVVCKDGRIKEIQFNRTVLEDGRTIVMLSDITEWKIAEEQIRHAKEEWERTFHAIDDIVTIQDTQMRIIRANRAAERMMSPEQKELTGKHCFDLLYGKNEPCHGCPAWQTLQNHTHNSAEIEFPHLNKIFLVSTSPIFDDNGKFIALVHTAKDITEKRKMEEELLKGQKLESIGILAGGIAHDFNNILTGILGNISLAKTYINHPDKILAKLQDAQKATLMAKDLTQQLLTFAKGGAPILQTESITDLIRESVNFAIRGSNLKCEFFLPDDLWTVEVDKGQMNQVINNLIINANQAMPEGGLIEVYGENVFLKAEEIFPVQDGKYVKISIKDCGIGIKEEYLQKIFDPYFTTKSDGTGLGLATVYSIVKKHNGHITVESREGVGTTFHIYLPASEKKISKIQSVEEEFIYDGGKGKILLMDDEEIVRQIGGEMLNHIGYEVEFARDGSEAIEAFEKARNLGDPFDVVIMDLTVPGGMGGEETVKKMLELDPRTKAVVSSGYSNDPVMSRFKEYGFKGVIAKPYKIRELSKILHNIINEID